MTEESSPSPYQDDLFTPEAKSWYYAFALYALIINLASVVVGKMIATGPAEFSYTGFLLLIVLIMRPIMRYATLVGTLVGGTLALLWSMAFHGAFIEIDHLAVVSPQFAFLNILLGIFVFAVAALAADFIARMVDRNFDAGVLSLFSALRKD